jgi:hypothetical protein
VGGPQVAEGRLATGGGDGYWRSGQRLPNL